MESQMTDAYDMNVVYLSAGIAFLGSYITICLCEQYRLSLADHFQAKFLSRHGFLWSMTLALGGIAVWCMHFVGMSSLILKYPDGDKVDVNFYLLPTLVSLAVSLLFAFVGLWYASHDIMFGKTKAEIVELYKHLVMRGSLGQARKMSTFKMLFILTTRAPQHLLVGGFTTGLGVSAMHYLGMWAMRFSGAVVHWDDGCLITAVCFAMGAGTISFWILFRLLSVYPHLEYLRLLCACIMAFAVTGMHYTGMNSAIYKYRPGDYSNQMPPGMSASFDLHQAFYIGLLVAVVLGLILIMISFGELRAVVYRQGAQVKSHEAFVAFLSSDERYTAYVSKWFPTFKRQKSLSSMLMEPSVTDRTGLNWTVRSRQASRSNPASKNNSARVAPTSSSHENTSAPVTASKNNSAVVHEEEEDNNVELFDRDLESGDSRDDY